jgi:hypothetical protein
MPARVPLPPLPVVAVQLVPSKVSTVPFWPTAMQRVVPPPWQ